MSGTKPSHRVMIKIGYHIVLMGILLFAGCDPAGNHSAGVDPYPVPFNAGSVDVQEASVLSAYPEDSQLKEYVFSPGDTIDVKFFYTPDLNETLIIRPDGQISLQIIGEVKATGKTPAQLRGLLKRLYAPYLKDPEISVIVRSFSNQRVFVGGQVMKPGTVEMSDQMTVLEALIEAGGLDYRQAQAKNVVVIRYHKNKRYGYKINMEPVLEGKESRPFFLEPKDIVYVPRTEIAKVNQWIDQHINQIVPQTGFYLSERRGDMTIGIDTSSRY